MYRAVRPKPGQILRIFGPPARPLASVRIDTARIEGQVVERALRHRLQIRVGQWVPPPGRLLRVALFGKAGQKAQKRVLPMLPEKIQIPHHAYRYGGLEFQNHSRFLLQNYSFPI